MKRILLWAAVIAVSGCQVASNGLTVQSFHAAKEDCTIDLDTVVALGGLDVSSGSPSFKVGVLISGGETFTTPEVKADTLVLENANRNRPVIDRIELNYKFTYPDELNKPPLDTAALERASYDATIPFFGSTGEASGFLELLSPKLSDALAGLVGDEKVNVSVGLRAVGHMSGGGNTISTNELRFPIQVIRCAQASPFIPACGFYSGQSFSAPRCR